MHLSYHRPKSFWTASATRSRFCHINQARDRFETWIHVIGTHKMNVLSRPLACTSFLSMSRKVYGSKKKLSNLNLDSIGQFHSRNSSVAPKLSLHTQPKNIPFETSPSFCDVRNITKVKCYMATHSPTAPNARHKCRSCTLQQSHYLLLFPT